ncbi:MAG: hypothetical protein BGO69_13025 [Bacteroidetes bacterium 46-16]|nr:MAG: hypothetical protein BGO69_13025 [Bacteroidetes bacterium 46-16]
MGRLYYFYTPSASTLSKLRKIFLHEYMLVFLFCLAAIQGPAFSLMDNYDQSANADCQTYMGLAKLDFDQSPVRRYRPIVPMAASVVYHTLGRAFNKLQPGSFPGDFALAFSFLLINSILLSIWGVLIYRFCKDYGIATVPALIALLVMLTCRWTPYIAGTALVDSLYCIVVTLSLLAIVEKNTAFTLWAIFLGPFAKESFIFIAPVLFFFSHMPKPKLFLYFIISGILVFAFRYLYDHYAGFPADSGLQADLYHFSYVKGNLHKLFSFHGVYDILSNPGLWLLAPVAAFLLLPSYKTVLRQGMEWYMFFFMISILVHMLLSGYLERMFYLTMPLLCMMTGLAIDEGRKQYLALKK